MRQRIVLRVAVFASEQFSHDSYGVTGILKMHYERRDLLADLLFEHDFDLEVVRACRNWTGTVKDFVLQLWDPQYLAGRDQEQLLVEVTAALLEYWDRPEGERGRAGIRDAIAYNRLRRELELEGYLWRDGRLLRLEENVLDPEEEGDALTRLYLELGLPHHEQVLQDVEACHEHYVEGRWGDCLKHARDVYETVTLETVRHLDPNVGNRRLQPREVRDRLLRLQVLSRDEKAFTDNMYFLLCAGGHPNQLEQVTARIRRLQALAETHMILLKLEARLQAPEGV